MPIDTDEDKEEIITPAYPTTYKDKVKKLKKIIKEMQKNYNNLLDATKYNTKELSTRIKDLEDKFNKVSDITEALSKDTNNSQRLYKEHIKYTAAFTATGKDLGEIL
jgi:Mg2+ and Co2+ transporter CorA